MAKSNKPKKKGYKLLKDFATQKKSYKAGDRIYLTKKGYNYLRIKKIVE